ncbi:MAG: hypothetical protein DRQ59_05950 [Gammaproteobacteria bacterium]|nr:MAG: hypothetical protein DRQ59_05950 [Gammaproteobacteria bacterium]
MRVRVEGSVNPDGVTGTAIRIKSEDQVEGPISSAVIRDADFATGSFSVLATTVIMDSADTFFEGTSYDTLSTGENIEVNGFFDGAGVVHATRIEKKAEFVAGITIVELKGNLSSLAGTTFTLGAMTVEAALADLSGVPGGLLANGQFIEVKGTLASAGAMTLTATIVELEDNGLGDDGNKISIEGIITRFVSIADFDVDGNTVNASSAVLSPANLVLAAGMRVEAEGTVNGGVLQAISVELRGGDIKIHAVASNANAAAGTFDLTPVAGQAAISVTVTSATRMEDKVSGASPFTVVNISDGDFIEARGFADSTGTGIIATRIRRELADDIILEGVVTAGTASSTSVTVLGVAVPVDANTEFKNLANADITQAQFFGLTTLGTSVIKLKDREDINKNAVGIADEVEFQTP